MRSQVWIQIVRESLESALPPAVATALLFDALDTWGAGVPEDVEQMHEMVQGPLAKVLATRLGQDTSEVLVLQITAQLATCFATDEEEEELEVDIDLDDAMEDQTQPTSLIRAVPHPVTVLVVSGDATLAKRLLLAIGEARVYAHSVSDEAALRHATFSTNPMIVVVDGSTPPSIRPPELAAALSGLPDATLSVIFGDRTDYGRELRARLEPSPSRVVFVSREDGVEPLHDFVLSRYRRSSTIPPPILK